MKKKTTFILLVLFILILSGEVFSTSCRITRNEKVVFEEVGQFNDGGRPNSIQIIGDLIYLADGTDGLEIIRFRENRDSIAKERSGDFPVLAGPYLGQEPPGEKPVYMYDGR